MVEKDTDISKSLTTRPNKKRIKGKLKIVEIHVKIPADALELEGERIIAEMDNTPEPTVIKHLSPGVDVIEPGKPQKIVLKEKRFKIK